MKAPISVHLAVMFLWRCLFVCLVMEIRAGAFVLPLGKGRSRWHYHLTPLGPFCDTSRMPSSPPRQVTLYNNKVDSFAEKEDDDDISQHNIMIDDDNHDNKANATKTTTTAKGYRPIESWHQENLNPSHVLDHLKREQAHWKGKFEDLGGDGI